MAAAQVEAAGRGWGGGTRSFIAPPRRVDAHLDSPIKLSFGKKAVSQKANQNRIRESREAG